jgi:hypothetical protein
MGIKAPSESQALALRFSPAQISSRQSSISQASGGVKLKNRTAAQIGFDPEFPLKRLCNPLRNRQTYAEPFVAFVRLNAADKISFASSGIPLPLSAMPTWIRPSFGSGVVMTNSPFFPAPDTCRSVTIRRQLS